MKVLISDYDGTLYVDENDIKINAEKINEFRKNKYIYNLNSKKL